MIDNKEVWTKLDDLVVQIYRLCDKVPNVDGYIAEIQECVDALKGKIEAANIGTPK